MCSSLFYSLVVVDRSAANDFKFNTETEFQPILGLLASNLNNAPTDNNNEGPVSSIQNNHHPALLSVLAEQMSVKPEEIHDFELWVITSLPTTRVR